MSQTPPALVRPTLIQNVELGELHAQPGSAAPLLPERLEAFAGVKATVSVVAGQAVASIGELLALKDGDVLELDRGVDALFDVVLDGHVLGRGELVAVGEHFGVRMREVSESTGG